MFILNFVVPLHAVPVRLLQKFIFTMIFTETSYCSLICFGFTNICRNMFGVFETVKTPVRTCGFALVIYSDVIRV